MIKRGDGDDGCWKSIKGKQGPAPHQSYQCNWAASFRTSPPIPNSGVAFGNMPAPPFWERPTPMGGLRLAAHVLLQDVQVLPPSSRRKEQWKLPSEFAAIGEEDGRCLWRGEMSNLIGRRWENHVFFGTHALAIGIDRKPRAVLGMWMHTREVTQAEPKRCCRSPRLLALLTNKFSSTI